MIVCSCNVFSESEVRALASVVRPRVSQVYACLGYASQCGRCAHTIKQIVDATSPIPKRHATWAETAACSATGGIRDPEHHFVPNGGE